MSQRGRVLAGACLGTAWMVCLTLPPYLLSRAVDDGLATGRWPALVGWVAAILGTGVLNAWLAIMRHRTMTRVRMDAAFRTVEVVAVHATRLGAALPGRATAGEVVTIGFGDAAVMATVLTITGPGVGAVLAYIVVAVLLLSVSPLLAAVVLLGVPLLVAVLGPLLGRLRGAETAYRGRQGELAARFADIAAGLRVLNGIGGKDVYAQRYRLGSQGLRDQGYRVGAVTSWIHALGVGLPTLFLGAVTWLAARMAVQGDITVGELVALYGYAAVLVVPVSSFVEGGYDLSRGLVAARRVIHFLSLQPDPLRQNGDDRTGEDPAPLERRGTSRTDHAEGQGTHRTDHAESRGTNRTDHAESQGGGEARHARDWDAGKAHDTEGRGGGGLPPALSAVLWDPVSGVEIAPGLVTALVSARAVEAAAVLDRLGGFAGPSAIWGGVRLAEMDRAAVRERILVADNEADLFAGTLREVIAGSRDPDDAAVQRAVHAAMAEDIVQALPYELDSPVAAQGRNLSGGQRQRVRLARVLLADPEILLAAEPTSALDAHTEATVAARLRTARAGRTTAVTTTSPLVLDRADRVYYLVNGMVAATGDHHDLLRDEPGYRLLVSRGTEDDDDQADGSDAPGSDSPPDPTSPPDRVGASTRGFA